MQTVKTRMEIHGHSIIIEGKVPRIASRLTELLRDEHSLMYQLLKPGSVNKLLEAHRSGRDDNHKLLFSLVMLEEWFRGKQTDTKPAIGRGKSEIR